MLYKMSATFDNNIKDAYIKLNQISQNKLDKKALICKYICNNYGYRYYN